MAVMGLGPFFSFSDIHYVSSGNTVYSVKMKFPIRVFI